MAIEKRTTPYEYLVRFNADGSIAGQHIKYLERVTDTVTGEVYSEKEGHALSVGDAKSAVMLAAALGAVGAGLSRATAVEKTKREAAEAEVRKLEAKAEAR